MKNFKKYLFSLTLLASLNGYSNTIENPSTQTTVNINNGVHLQGFWELDIDFDNLVVRIYGNDNIIKNSSETDTNPLRFTILLVEDQPSEDSKVISGYKVTDIDLEPLKPNVEIKNTIIETNFENRVPPGTYYPVLILSELDKDGTYKSKSTLRFKNKYTL